MKFYAAADYQPQCQELFERYQAKILGLLPEARIAHIGASSIEGAISKGDLDIFVGVDAKDLEASVLALHTLDFAVKKNTLRTPALCMLESTCGEEVALQVVANGSEFESFLVFRDRLRNSHSLLDEYNKLKIRCRGMSMKDYRVQKDKFISKVLRDC